MNKLNILNDPDTDICKLANWAAKGMSASLSDMGHYSFEPAYIQWVLYGRGRIPQPRYNLFSQNKHQWPRYPRYNTIYGHLLIVRWNIHNSLIVRKTSINSLVVRKTSTITINFPRFLYAPPPPPSLIVRKTSTIGGIQPSYFPRFYICTSSSSSIPPTVSVPPRDL